MSASSASFERPIDLVHLARQTLGDRDLEREILALFVRQSMTLLKRMVDTPTPQEACDLAHTLKGSARAVGAWRVASAAEEVEQALGRAIPSSEPALKARLEVLHRSIDEANHMIATLVPA